MNNSAKENFKSSYSTFRKTLRDSKKLGFKAWKDHQNQNVFLNEIYLNKIDFPVSYKIYFYKRIGSLYKNMCNS